MEDALSRLRPLLFPVRVADDASPAVRGVAGETAAMAWLVRRGYAILVRNYRCRAGELDIVARRGADVVFVEVKTRGSRAIAPPAEQVDARKRTRMVRAARNYLAHCPGRDPGCRFDVVEVVAGGGRVKVVRHLKDAFRPGWG
jgi:putative endonuclease